MEKVKVILSSINSIIEKLVIINKDYGKLLKEDVLKIIEKKNIFIEINTKDIFSKSNKFIHIDDFNNTEKFYNILYDLFLYKMHIFAEKDSILFKTFNQLYYYRKYIKYISIFLEKNPQALNDDIIKEKLYEIIHSLKSDDDLYKKDFYFFISIYHIHNHYRVNDILIPSYEKLLANKYKELTKIKNSLKFISQNKIDLINDIIALIKCKNSKESELVNILSKIQKEIEDKDIIYNKIEAFEKVNWEETFTESEKILIDFLKSNSLNNNDIINLNKDLKLYTDLKEEFEYYYIDGMKKFISLNNEDKYIIINSYDDYSKKFYKNNIEYITNKNSYIEGMKNENNLKDIIREIIETNDFYDLIKNILISDKVKNYFKNPIQYQINQLSNEIEKYYEKDIEKKYWNEIKNTIESENKEIIISNFVDIIKYF